MAVSIRPYVDKGSTSGGADCARATQSCGPGPYDCLNAPLLVAIATHPANAAGVLKS